MSFNKHQLRSLVQRTLAEHPRLNSPAAVELVLGTIAQESQFGTYLRQLGGGPARGICQVERATFDDLVNRFSMDFPVILAFDFEDLEWDLKASILMCRIKYFSCPGTIPKDLAGQANYWKKYYNTELGAGKISEYIEAYRRYVQ